MKSEIDYMMNSVWATLSAHDLGLLAQPSWGSGPGTGAARGHHT
jgi:hypothetical protein